MPAASYATASRDGNEEPAHFRRRLSPR